MIFEIRFVEKCTSKVKIKAAGYNWLTEDVDPKPGTKEFAKEYRKTYAKYQRMRRKYEAYRKDRR